MTAYDASCNPGRGIGTMLRHDEWVNYPDLPRKSRTSGCVSAAVTVRPLSGCDELCSFSPRSISPSGWRPRMALEELPHLGRRINAGGRLSDEPLGQRLPAGPGVAAPVDRVEQHIGVVCAVAVCATLHVG